MKVQEITMITESILNESMEAMKLKINKILLSGNIDIHNWDINTNPMVLPKSIVIALLEDEANQYKAVGTCFEKEVKKNVKNIKAII